jgi:hypothetical protein
MSLTFLSGPITKTLRTVWLSAGVRDFASPEVDAGNMPYSLDTLKSASPRYTTCCVPVASFT